MIYLNQYTQSTVVTTVQDIATNQADPYYIWQIKSLDSNKEYVFSAKDYSYFPYYFSYFTFSVIPGATYGLTAGIIPATEIGEFSYTVYETENYGDLNLNNAIKVVNKGLLQINGTYSVVRKEHNIDTERKIYKRN